MNFPPVSGKMTIIKYYCRHKRLLLYLELCGSFRIVQDRYGYSIYMTQERWLHILESRPELEPYLDLFLETLKTGRREQDSLAPNEYRYFKRFDELLPEHNHLIMIVIFRTRLNDDGEYAPNNFVVTGWANYIWSQT